MSYVDAIYLKDADKVSVAERINGQRVIKDYPIRWEFYYDDPAGKFRTIYDTPVSRVVTRSRKEFQKELKIHSNVRTWESDINPVHKCLAEYYRHQPSPQLHVAFLDIETAFNVERGFSKPDDPFTEVTAITVYLDWLQQLVTLALIPPSLTMEAATELASPFENTFLFTDETELLTTFLELIGDADVLSGWNSEDFDIPYLVNRICLVLSKDDTRRMCLWDQYPKYKTFERYGSEHFTFELTGRIHLDYLQLYRKYTYEERHSYSLDAIGEFELGEHKTAYEGTLDQLYNQDFRKFIEYNRQDVMLLAKLDHKLRFIDLASEIAHDSTVLIASALGSVAVTDQAIINEAHDHQLVVPDKQRKEDAEGAAGAYVAQPKKGLHDWIGAVDINSLYPSAIRALNMAPETIVGQLRPDYTTAYIQKKMAAGCLFAEAWEGLFGTLEYTSVMEQDRGTEITIDWVNGSYDVLSAAEVYKLIWDSGQNWVISANGTIFSLDKVGIIPGLLSRWYAERKELQKKKKEATDKADIAFWDKRQLVKKINLNSAYGALLNPHCRFNDKRIGQSTTLSGRTIAKHMNAYTNQCITGEYNHTGDAIIYADTDSSYFTAWPTVKAEVEAGTLEWNREVCVGLYDSIADQINASFPDFCKQAFHMPEQNGAIIRCGRELVGSKGLYITKKRYAVLIYDLEGKRLDVNGSPGKLKAMGLDLKRSDTPKFVQEFLKDILLEVLIGHEQDAILEKIRLFKESFQKLPAWEKGTPKRVNNLTRYRSLIKQGKANAVPGHVRASLNWNTMREINHDKHSIEVIDGMKTIVCKLKSNPMKYTSIAYPIDELHLPKWFTELPFDTELMESTILDTKIENVLGVLEWDLTVKFNKKTKVMHKFFRMT